MLTTFDDDDDDGGLVFSSNAINRFVCSNWIFRFFFIGIFVSCANHKATKRFRKMTHYVRRRWEKKEKNKNRKKKTKMHNFPQFSMRRRRSPHNSVCSYLQLAHRSGASGRMVPMPMHHLFILFYLFVWRALLLDDAYSLCSGGRRDICHKLRSCSKFDAIAPLADRALDAILLLRNESTKQYIYENLHFFHWLAAWPPGRSACKPTELAWICKCDKTVVSYFTVGDSRKWIIPRTHRACVCAAHSSVFVLNTIHIEVSFIHISPSSGNTNCYNEFRCSAWPPRAPSAACVCAVCSIQISKYHSFSFLFIVEWYAFSMTNSAAAEANWIKYTDISHSLNRIREDARCNCVCTQTHDSAFAARQRNKENWNVFMPINRWNNIPTQSEWKRGMQNTSADNMEIE